MAIKPIGTTQLTWGSLMGRGNREPLDDTQLNYSYTDLLWELNQMKGNPSDNSYTVGANKGGSGNFYVGLITSVPYVNDDVTDTSKKVKNSHYMYKDGALVAESIGMRGPWYVSYCGTDTRYGNGGQGKYGFNPDGVGNTYYADRIVLRQEMDYTLDNGFVRKTQLGTYYTGVGLWYDSYTASKEYSGGKECPDGTYFPTTSYAEIFNDYTNNIATGVFSHAEGNNTKATGDNSHAEGNGTTASGTNSHAEGLGSKSQNKNAHAEGNATDASGENSHAEGSSTTASGINSHAEGRDTTASGVDSHAEGTANVASGNQSHVEGNDNAAVGAKSHAEGLSNAANGNHSHAEGNDNTASGENSHSEGKSTTASGTNSHSEGKSTTALGDDSHAENSHTFAGKLGSHTEGYMTMAYGNYAHLEALSNVSYAAYSHSSGSYNWTYAEAPFSSTEGAQNKVYGAYSHAEGNRNKTFGSYSHVEGYVNITYGMFAHAEGRANISYGDSSHTEGRNNISYGSYTHVEGRSNMAYGTYSNIKGNWNVSYNDAVFSAMEGFSNVAYGAYTHIEGNNSKVYAAYAHVEGIKNWSYGVADHIVGSYNSSYVTSTQYLNNMSGTSNKLYTGSAGIAEISGKSNKSATVSSVSNVSGQSNTSNAYTNSVVEVSGQSNIIDSYTGITSVTGKKNSGRNESGNLSVDAFNTYTNAKYSEVYVTGANNTSYVNGSVVNMNGNSNFFKNDGNSSTWTDTGFIEGSYNKVFVENGVNKKSDIHIEGSYSYVVIPSANGITYATNRKNIHVEGVGHIAYIHGSTAHIEGHNSYLDLVGGTAHIGGAYNYVIQNYIDGQKLEYCWSNSNIVGSYNASVFAGIETTITGNRNISYGVSRGYYEDGAQTCNVTILGNHNSSYLNGCRDQYHYLLGSMAYAYADQMETELASHMPNILIDKGSFNSSYMLHGGVGVGLEVFGVENKTIAYANVFSTIDVKGYLNNTYLLNTNYVINVDGERNETAISGSDGNTNISGIKNKCVISDAGTIDVYGSYNNLSYTSSYTSVCGSYNYLGNLSNWNGNVALASNNVIGHANASYNSGSSVTVIGKNNKTVDYLSTDMVIGKNSYTYGSSNNYTISIGTGNFSYSYNTSGIVNLGKSNFTYASSDDTTLVNGSNNASYLWSRSKLIVNGELNTAYSQRNSHLLVSGAYNYASGSSVVSLNSFGYSNAAYATNTSVVDASGLHNYAKADSESVLHTTGRYTSAYATSKGMVDDMSIQSTAKSNSSNLTVTRSLLGNTYAYEMGSTVNAGVGSTVINNGGDVLVQGRYNYYNSLYSIGSVNGVFNSAYSNQGVVTASGQSNKVFSNNSGTATVDGQGNRAYSEQGANTLFVNGVKNVAYGYSELIDGQYYNPTSANVTGISNWSYHDSGVLISGIFNSSYNSCSSFLMGGTLKANKYSYCLVAGYNNEGTNAPNSTDLLVEIGNGNGRTGRDVVRIYKNHGMYLSSMDMDGTYNSINTYSSNIINFTNRGLTETTYSNITSGIASVTGSASFATGTGLKVTNAHNNAIGDYNENVNAYAMVGIGTSDSNRKNAFWISRGTTTGTNGVAYFSNGTYVYTNNHDPGIYPNNKEDKSWSQVLTYDMYRNSYTYIYQTFNDKINTMTKTTNVKSLDSISVTPSTNVLNYTEQTFDNDKNTWPTTAKTISFPVLNDGTTINQTGGNASKAGVMTADQYNKLVDRITKLEQRCIWKSELNGNQSTYFWSGTLADFNNLTTKPKDTTFIITN